LYTFAATEVFSINYVLITLLHDATYTELLAVIRQTTNGSISLFLKNKTHEAVLAWIYSYNEENKESTHNFGKKNSWGENK